MPILLLLKVVVNSTYLELSSSMRISGDVSSRMREFFNWFFRNLTELWFSFCVSPLASNWFLRPSWRSTQADNKMAPKSRREEVFKFRSGGFGLAGLRLFHFLCPRKKRVPEFVGKRSVSKNSVRHFLWIFNFRPQVRSCSLNFLHSRSFLNSAQNPIFWQMCLIAEVYYLVANFGSPTVRNISFALSTLSWKMGIALYFSRELSIRTIGVFFSFSSLIVFISFC